jgi:HPt (histidine-containing phosphotransfer) domain-containing protein
MKVVENNELDIVMRRKEIHAIKGTALMLQTKQIAKLASEVENILKSSISKVSRMLSRELLSSPSTTLIPSSTLSNMKQNGLEEEEGGEEEITDLIEELKTQIMRIAHTVNSRSEINMR